MIVTFSWIDFLVMLLFIFYNWSMAAQISSLTKQVDKLKSEVKFLQGLNGIVSIE
jgi:type VI protein secretion system component VasF